jgi:hypothetical protein
VTPNDWPTFVERVLAAVVHSEPHLDHAFLARHQRLQNKRPLFLEAEMIIPSEDATTASLGAAGR